MLGKDDRMSKDECYLEMAKATSMRSTCLRRCYGAIIVKNDTTVSTGYNGAPRRFVNCNKIGKCKREILQIPSGERYELCRSVHAEANAIINAPKERMAGATIYLYGRLTNSIEPLEQSVCCDMCKRMIINAGIKYVKSYKNGRVHIIDVNKWETEDRADVENFLYLPEK